MISFKQYLTEKTQKQFTGQSGCYCSMMLDPESINSIETLCKSCGLPFTQKDEIHCTVVYSPDAVPHSIPVHPNMPIHATIIGFDLFGPEKDCLVALLDSPDLQDINKRFVENGAVPTYQEYRPHITLHKCENGECPCLPTTFNPLQVKFVSMTIEDIDKDK